LRFLVDFMRGDDRGGNWLFLAPTGWASLALALWGVGILFSLKRRKII
jgi:hypothetical protein